MLEEGLDVQSCNLVIRFDLSATICSFIQSRGRARMQNSDFVCMVKRLAASFKINSLLLIDFLIFLLRSDEFNIVEYILFPWGLIS